ncbi:MAG: hypothetical protein QOF48_2049 [Verrucomicrobiota bacterium]
MGASVLAAFFFLSPFAGLRAQRESASEYEIKAALLLNFARFTEWPGTSFASPKAPLVVGVVGRDPFGTLLEKTFSAQTMNGRSIVVKRLTADQDLKQCHLLFVPASEKRRQRELLEKIRGLPILTVGERDDFLDHGGEVQFLFADESIRFSINLNPAKAAKLRINASVLRLAISVRGRYE